MAQQEPKRVATEFFKDDLPMYDRMTTLVSDGIENFHIWKNQDALWELSYPFRDVEQEPVDQFDPPPKRYA